MIQRLPFDLRKNGPLLLYSLLLLILLLFSVGFSLRLLSSWSLFVGLWLGAQFIWLDRLVYAYLHPQEGLSQKLGQELSQGLSQEPKAWLNRLRQAFLTLKARAGEQVNLSTQNVLFAAAWVPLAFFGLTSTTGWLGKGVVLGIGWQLAWRILSGLRGLERLNWLFWPIKRTVTLKEQLWVARSFLVAFGIVTLLV